MWYMDCAYYCCFLVLFTILISCQVLSANDPTLGNAQIKRKELIAKETNAILMVKILFLIWFQAKALALQQYLR